MLVNRIARTLLACLVVLGLGAAQAQSTEKSLDLGTAQDNAALTLVGRILVPNMTGTWDHVTANAATSRRFAFAQEDNQVRVFDLEASKPLFTISGGFNRPQGLYYVTGKRVLAVTNGKDGTLRSCDGTTYQPI
jgi:hypothetical protein